MLRELASNRPLIPVLVTDLLDLPLVPEQFALGEQITPRERSP